MDAANGEADNAVRALSSGAGGLGLCPKPVAPQGKMGSHAPWVRVVLVVETSQERNPPDAQVPRMWVISGKAQNMMQWFILFTTSSGMLLGSGNLSQTSEGRSWGISLGRGFLCQISQPKIGPGLGEPSTLSRFVWKTVRKPPFRGAQMGSTLASKDMGDGTCSLSSHQSGGVQMF